VGYVRHIVTSENDFHIDTLVCVHQIATIGYVCPIVTFVNIYRIAFVQLQSHFMFVRLRY